MSVPSISVRTIYRGGSGGREYFAAHIIGVAFNSPPLVSTCAPLSSKTLQNIRRPLMAAQCSGYAINPDAGSGSLASGLAPCANRKSSTSRAPCIAAQCIAWFNYTLHTVPQNVRSQGLPGAAREGRAKVPKDHRRQALFSSRLAIQVTLQAVSRCS